MGMLACGYPQLPDDSRERQLAIVPNDPVLRAAFAGAVVGMIQGWMNDKKLADAAADAAVAGLAAAAAAAAWGVLAGADDDPDTGGLTT